MDELPYSAATLLNTCTITWRKSLPICNSSGIFIKETVFIYLSFFVVISLSPQFLKELINFADQFINWVVLYPINFVDQFINWVVLYPIKCDLGNYHMNASHLSMTYDVNIHEPMA